MNKIVGKFQLFACLLSCVFIVSASYGDLGDVNWDGIVDGRDALRIMRIVDGFDAALPEDTQWGDVYPNPGINGRRIGDGQLTREDAIVILRMEVGLISEIEINANYDRSAPWIDDCVPTSGAAGDIVTLVGGNFIADPVGDNSVFLGGTPAEIVEASGNLLSVRVPENAESGLFRVHTPGGVAESPYEFRVTQQINGVLDAGPLRPSEFLVVTPFDGGPVEGNGRFQVRVLVDGMTLLGAGMEDEVANNTFLALILPGEESESASENAPIKIDARTTAQALVFLCPFIYTANLANAKVILQALQNNPEVQALADVIAKRYAEKADGLDDPEVEAAYIKAVQSYMNSLPAGMTFSPNDLDSLGKTSGRAMPAFPAASLAPVGSPLPESIRVDASGPHSLLPMQAGRESRLSVRQYSVDRFDVHASYDERKNEIKPSLKDQYGPLDYITILYRIDPDDMPLGVNESFLQLRRRPLRTLNYRVGNVLQGSLWTARIDVAYNVIDMLFSRAGEYAFKQVLPEDLVNWYEGDQLPLEDRNEGVYMLRSFSGALVDNDVLKYDFEAIHNIPGGEGWHYFACASNVMQAAVDFWDLITQDSYRWSRTFFKKGIKNSIRRLTAELTNTDWNALSARNKLKICAKMVVDFIIAAGTTTPQRGLTYVQDKVRSSVSAGLRRGVVLLDALDRISSAGRVVERMLGLAGCLIYPQIPRRISLLPHFLDPQYYRDPDRYFRDTAIMVVEPVGPTPLESILFVVGTPFDPIVERIEPTSGRQGDRIAITGDKLMPLNGSANVRFGGQAARVISGERTRLIVEVPSVLIPQGETSRSVELTIGTSASSETLLEYFNVIRFPRIDSVEPAVGYSRASNQDFANIFYGFGGTEILLKGDELYVQNQTPSRYVKVGDSYAEPIRESGTEMSARLSYVNSGTTEIFITDSFHETRHIPFQVLGNPEITSIDPTEIKSGQFVEITGENLATVFSPDWVQIGLEVKDKETGNVVDARVERFSMDSASFQIINPVQRDTILTVKVWNPAGGSNIREILLKPGVITYDEQSTSGLRQGFRFTVTVNESGMAANGRLSLDEACAFARGDENPFSSIWDDRNERWTVTRVERKELSGTDNQGNPIYRYVWVESSTDKQTLDRGNGPLPEKRDIYYVDIYHSDHGGRTTEPYLFSSVSLDEKESDREEGDLIGMYAGTDYSELLGERNTYNGALFADDIIVPTSFKSDLIAINPAIGTGDRLWIESSSSLQITGEFVQERSNCQFLFRDVVALHPITIKGSGVKFNWESIEFRDEGFILKETFACGLFGTAINRCQGVGIRVDQGGGHLLSFNEISNCEGAGISLERSDQNTLRNYQGGDPTIHDCAMGLSIWGGRRNTAWLHTYNNLYHGIELERTDLNTVSGNTYNNKENGVNILGRCKENTINFQSYSNANGLVLDANADLDTCRLGGAYYGNKQYGIWLQGSAVENNLNEVFVHSNGSHGILIEGEGSGQNRLLSCFVGSAKQEQSNGGDGIRIQNEVYWTHLDKCYVVGNTGNGIYIGPNVNHVEIRNCRVGFTDLNYDPAVHFPNQGWGLLAPEKPIELLMDNNVFGINKLGGMRIVGAQKYEYSRGIPPLSIQRTLVGYKYTVYGMDRKFLFGWPGLSGIGIDLEDIKSATLDTVYINSFDTGLRLQGENSSANTIHNLFADKAKLCGAEIVKSVSDVFSHVFFSNNGGHGLSLASTRETVIRDCPESFQKNAGDGIALNGCEGVVIDNVSLKNNQGRGIGVQSSKNTTVRRCEIRESGGDGVSMTGPSENATLDWVALFNNKGHGFSLTDCRNVLITNISSLGRLHRNLQDCLNNEGCGVYLNNCDTIYLGASGGLNSGLRIANNKKKGVWIQGDKTGLIAIQGNTIQSNLEGGIQAEAGKPIAIGGFGPSQGNFLSQNREFNIWASGSDTRLQILSNQLEFKDTTQKFFIGANTGILLSGGIHDARIDSNEIYNHKQNGIVIREGSHDNAVQGNKIQYNAQNGILVQGADSVRNNLTRNLITGNLFKGIRLDGGNNNIDAPVMRRISGMGENLSGIVKAPLGSVVEIYADPDDEGKTFLASTRIQGNAFFIKYNAPLGQQLHAIVIHPDGNTSEFGPNEIFPGNQFESFVYVEKRDNQSDLFFQAATENTPRRLTNTPNSETHPKYSPNGGKILYVSNQKGNRDVWVMDNNGQNAYPAVEGSSEEYDPAWSPDGQSFVYASGAEGSADVYRYRLIPEGMTGLLSYNSQTKSKNLKVLANDAVALRFTSVPGFLTEVRFFIENPTVFQWRVYGWENSQPAALLYQGETTPSEAGWHSVPLDRLAIPSDFLVAFSPLQDNVPELGLALSGSYSVPWRFTAADGKWTFDWRYFMIEAVVEAAPPLNLTNHPADDRQPVWSPKGNKIAFASNRSGVWDIWTMNADGSEAVSLTHGEGENTSPAWTSYRDRIAFVSTRNGNPDIFVMNADGSGVEPVTGNETAETDPAWNPAGNKIYYSADYGSGREIYTLSTGSSNPVRVSRSGADAIQPHVAPAGFSLLPIESPIANSAERDAANSPYGVSFLVNGEPVKVSLSELEAQPGEVVNIDLSIQGADDLGGFFIRLLYDEGVLDLKSTSNDFFAADSLSAMNPERYNYNAGIFRYSGVRSIGFSGNETILNLSFQISGLLDEKDTLELVVDRVVLFDVLYNLLPFEIQNGLIHIQVKQTNVESWMIF